MQNNEHKSIVADMLSDWKGQWPTILKQPGENTATVLIVVKHTTPAFGTWYLVGLCQPTCKALYGTSHFVIHCREVIFSLEVAL